MMVLCAILISGCSIESAAEIRHRDAVEVVKEISYIKDGRTGLCFAVARGYRRTGLAVVECERVADHLEK